LTALIFAKWHPIDIGRLSKKFKHQFNRQIVDHHRKDFVEHHHVIERAVGLVRFKPIDFAEGL
jgi:hypothetical protein